MYIPRKVELSASTGLSTKDQMIADAYKADAALRGRRRAFTRDAMTYDQYTIDSTGAFLIGELERLDPTLHEPLVNVTWPRDIDLREDVTIADEVSSFTNSTFASAGGITPTGKAWISKDSNAITGVALDIGKTTHPLYLWAMEVKYTLPELESAQKLGRPIDVQKYDAMKIKHQMDIDEMVYVGDTTYNEYGLFNSNLVVPSQASGALGSGGPTGTGNTTMWANKLASGGAGPSAVLADVNFLLNATWAATGYSIMPTSLRIPPAQFGLLVSTIVSSAGNQSVLEFLRNNSLCNAANGRPLDIQPVKWLTGRGAGGFDRMVAYTRDMNRVRFPLVPLQRTPLEYRSLYQITTYFGRLGVIEMPYPETIGYMDAI